MSLLTCKSEEICIRLCRDVPGRLEVVPLKKALQRVLACDAVATMDVPYQDESLRDGYAVLDPSMSEEDNDSRIYKVVDEIGAGEKGASVIRPGQACRVMTGAALPTGCDRVVPQENCRRSDKSFVVENEYLKRRQSFIRRQGSDMKAGELLASAGTIIDYQLQSRMATAGVEGVEVFQKPRVYYFCSGKELISSRKDFLAGKKFSTNQYILGALIKNFSGDGHYLGIVDDDLSQTMAAMDKAIQDGVDILISTGGTGGGKYDLMQRAFADLGGEILCTSLVMRPGKSVVLGKIKDTVYLGLPGPASAVETLFFELVAPLLLQMAGCSESYPRLFQAHLEDGIRIRSLNVTQLKGGVLSFSNGGCSVRLASAGESSNCTVVFPPDHSLFVADELIPLYLKNSPFT